MTAPLLRQIGRPGPVLCHYRMPRDRRGGYMVSRSTHGWLFSAGWRGHCIAIGWMH